MQSKGCNFKLNDPIWPVFELFWDFTDVSLICKFQESPIKTEQVRLMTKSNIGFFSNQGDVTLTLSRFHPCIPYLQVSGASDKNWRSYGNAKYYLWNLAVAIAARFSLHFHEKIMSSMPHQKHVIAGKWLRSACRLWRCNWLNVWTDGWRTDRRMAYHPISSQLPRLGLRNFRKVHEHLKKHEEIPSFTPYAGTVCTAPFDPGSYCPFRISTGSKIVMFKF